jgi:hypothetical protein
MAIHGLVLLRVLNRARDLFVDFDDEAVVGVYELSCDVLYSEVAPPPGDLRLASDLSKPFDVVGAARPQ